MTMKRRAASTWFLFTISLAFLTAPAGAVRAQYFPSTLEGYSVTSQAIAAPVRSSIPLVAPFRIVGVGTTLQIVDDTDPSHVRIVSQVVLPSPALDMALFGTLLYIADGSSGVVVMDVSNPITPNYIAGFKSPGASSVAVATNGSILYVCKGDGQIQVVNVKDPAHPKTHAYHSIRNANITDLAVSNNALIAACGPKGLVVFDITVPHHPLRMKRFKELKASTRLSMYGNMAAVTDGDLGLVLVDFTTWKTPRLRGSLAFQGAVLDAQFTLDLKQVVVALGNLGYALVDASDPTNLRSTAQVPSPSPVSEVSGTGWRPYLICGGAGLYSLDASTPSNPKTVLALAGTEPFGALAAVGSTVYISRGNAIELWNFFDPVHPIKTSSVATPALATDLLVDGNLLFASCQESGLLTFDISNPEAPALRSTFAVQGSAGQAAVYGTMLALADGSDGILLLDISNPSNPVQIGIWNAKTGYAGGVAFSSPTVLCVTQSAEGVATLDISTPASPKLMDKVAVEGNTGKAYFYQGMVYAMGGFVGWHIIDVTVPTKVSSVMTINTDGAIHAAFLGSTMIFCDGHAGFREYDLTDPRNPLQKTLFGSPTFSYQATFLPGGERVLSCREGGLWVLRPAECGGDKLLLPCEAETVSRFYRAAFIWKAQPVKEYEVQVSEEASFPDSPKTVKSSATVTKLDVPYWEPNEQAWDAILKRVRKAGILYWRVIFGSGSGKTVSETRTLSIR